jgi:hypothetical protein
MNKQELDTLMNESAQDAVIVSQEQFNLELDFSIESLAVVDTVISRFLQEYEKEVQEDKSVFTLCNIFGAYVGEVFKKEVGGEWQLSEQGNDAISIFLAIDNNTYAFAGICYEKLVNDSRVSVQAYFEQAFAAHSA